LLPISPDFIESIKCTTFSGEDILGGFGPDEGLTVRKRRARRKAFGTRAPVLVVARPNARWSLDFVNDQFTSGQRFRVLNVVDDVTRECLAAIPDTSISCASSISVFSP